jgi:predicted O-methyltransferase YrrM
MLKSILNKVHSASDKEFIYLKQNVLTVRSTQALAAALKWKNVPDLSGHEYLDDFDYLEDLNFRRKNDAGVLAMASCNSDPKIILEIGTAGGQTTALLAKNAPGATIYTVNIPPEEIKEGGNFVTYAPSRDETGKFYKERGFKNVKQIFANTANWEPDFGPIDVAFIDGSHDTDFVFNDTRKVLKQCKTGSIIMWHDFNPELVDIYKWINDVCKGVEKLYKHGLLKGKILHLQDSWIGIYMVR